MNKYATEYEILRGVSPTSRTPCIAQPAKEPVRVGVLLDEKKLVESGGLINHLDTIFLDDRHHDWMCKDGKFYYYGHGMGFDDVADIVVIYSTEDRV